MKKIQLLITFFAATLCSHAQAVSVSAATDGGRQVTATAITPYIVRVDNTAKGQTPATEQSVLAIVPEGDAAVMRHDGLGFITTGGIEVTADRQGTLTIATRRPGSTVFDSGARTTTGGNTVLSLATAGNGSLYGAGERGHKLNLRGDTLIMFNRQNYGYTGNDPRISQMGITMPLLLSADGYAIVFDDFAAATLIAGNPIKYISESNLPITYYYVAGDNAAELTERLTDLTGRQPIAPLWALGYITSKYGYHNQAETEGAVDTLKTRGYPLDGIVLDLYWYGREEDMGRLAWDPDQWPDAAGMLSRLDSLGVKTVAISQPYVLRNGRGIDNYDTLKEKGLFMADSTGASQEVTIWVGEGGMFDVSNPETRRWLADRYAALTDMGMGGWWGDLGEPEVHPESGIHANGLAARLYHNRYGNDWASIIADLYAGRYPDRRLLTLMRGGTTGLQRHSVFPWSTDVSRSWGGLEPQVRIMLSAGLSGTAYMSSDLGGFAVDPANPYIPELYVRWLQAGLFSPVFRTHATLYAEPYHYPQYEEILIALIKERYRWLPYNYTLAYENAVYGWPLVRPLDFRNNAAGTFDSISDEYMWGDEVLVAPVMTEGTTVRDIILPDGIWIDWSDPARHYTGRIDSYPAPLGKLPLFVRAGAFIPLADYYMDNTADYRADEFTIRYFPVQGIEGSYTLYDDNRLSPRAIDDGQYRLIHFAGTGNTINISSEGSYEGAPANVALHFKIAAGRPSQVAVNGRRTAFEYDETDGTVNFTVHYSCGTDFNIIFR